MTDQTAALISLPAGLEQEHRDALEVELQRVRDLLMASLDGLYPPLSSLAREAILRAEPLRRAVLVLTVAVSGTGDEHLQRERRILLAAALEMLTVALSIHATLLDEGDEAADHSLDKSVVGSTILTADYCFGRAAWMAAQTESPVVVDRFAQALKSVSEGLLRAHLEPETAHQVRDEETGNAPVRYDAGFELALASISAAAHLAELSSTANGAAMSLAPLVARAESRLPSAGELAEITSSLAPGQKARWMAALAWLNSLPRAE